MSLESQEEVLKMIEAKIECYPDFPKPGILFRHVLPIFRDPYLLDVTIDLMVKKLKHIEFDRILGIEARGFIPGVAIASKLKKPFHCIRKKGKLPGDLLTVEYQLEYGKDVLQVERNSIPKGSKCLIVDDLLATGGTIMATKELVTLSNSELVAALVMIELEALGAKGKLGVPLVTLFSY